MLAGNWRTARVVAHYAAGDDAWLTAADDQVSRYWERYRMVLLTNTRDRRNIVTSRFDPDSRGRLHGC